MTGRDLEGWLAWATELHPEAIALGLERVAEVWSRLGTQTLPCPLITVGGTNGKGSCVAMLEAMYRDAGYRTATYTSPHLVRYNERVRINGQAVNDQALCEAFARVEQVRQGVALTYFEFGTLAAMDLILRSAPEILVLEVGLGGRLDAVNLWDADVAIVTSIGLDHTAWLGATLEQIASEKAGIFRPQRPAIIGQSDAPARLREEAVRRGAIALALGREIRCEATSAGWVWRGPGEGTLVLPAPAMRGAFQYANAAAAVAAVAQLKTRLPVPVAAMRTGLQRVRLPGRFQVLPGAPTWILDVAHNGEAAQVLAANLRHFACQGSVRAVLAILSDKDAEAIVRPLVPWVSRWYLTQSDDLRAMPCRSLQGALETMLESADVEVTADLRAALASAEGASASQDGVLVLGSFTTVGEALRWCSAKSGASLLSI